MKNNVEEMALITLSLLQDSPSPLGARRLAEVLRANGVDVAEATAGRYLSELDELGWTRPRGRRGRTLTTAGRNELVRMRLLEQLNEASALIAAASEIRRSEDVLDMLFARRAIEPEAARLAALRATQQDIDLIRQAAEHCACCEGAQRISESRNFHRLLTRASYNRMLGAVAELLLEVNNQVTGRHELHKRSATAGAYERLAKDHIEIVDALQNRDGDRAEALTREHLDRIIEIARSKDGLSGLDRGGSVREFRCEVTPHL